MSLDDTLQDVIVAEALYHACATGVSVAVAGRWELESFVRKRIRDAGPGVHRNAAVRDAIVRWVRAGVDEMGAVAASVRLGAAGRDVVKTAFENVADALESSDT